MWKIWTVMQHILPEICGASPADRQHPGSGGSVPATALGGHQPSLIPPAFLALQLAEHHLKTCPYSSAKSWEFTIPFFAEGIRMFLRCKDISWFQAKDGLPHDFERSELARRRRQRRSWQLTLRNQAAFFPSPLPLFPCTRCQLGHAKMPAILPAPCLLPYGTARCAASPPPASRCYLPAGPLQQGRPPGAC